MAANTLPSGIGDLFLLAERMEAGLSIHGPWLLQNAVRAEELSGHLGATREAEAAYSIARARKSIVSQQFADAEAKLTNWLAGARLTVMLALGRQWSEAWVATGFSHRGTNVPKRIGARIALMSRLTEFFEAHRQYEVGFAQITAADAARMRGTITDAERELRLASLEAKAKKRARDSAEKQLRWQMRRVVIVLSVFAGKRDPRWLEFGLKQPKPEAPPKRAQTNVPAPAPEAVHFRVASESTINTAAA